MPKLLNLELVESLATALETMAFISLSPPEEPLLPPDDPVHVRIEFRGARSGRLELIASRDLGRLLLDNTLAGDASETLVMPNPNDALVELANVVCGTLLKRLPGGSRCEMQVPALRPFDAAAEWDMLVSEGAADVVLAEGMPVAIRIVEG
jgi:hypothetical protein